MKKVLFVKVESVLAMIALLKQNNDDQKMYFPYSDDPMVSMCCRDFLTSDRIEEQNTINPKYAFFYDECLGILSCHYKHELSNYETSKVVFNPSHTNDFKVLWWTLMDHQSPRCGWIKLFSSVWHRFKLGLLLAARLAGRFLGWFLLFFFRFRLRFLFPRFVGFFLLRRFARHPLTQSYPAFLVDGWSGNPYRCQQEGQHG